MCNLNPSKVGEGNDVLAKMIKIHVDIITDVKVSITPGRVTLEQSVYYQICLRYLNDVCFDKFKVLWNGFYENINVDLKDIAHNILIAILNK